MYLEELLQNSDNAHLESDEFECKARLNRDDIVGWLKSIAGFANAAGGDLYIGVEDKTNRLIGFDRREADNERNYFNNQVNEHLTPRPQMKVSFLRYTIKGSERYIIHVRVADSAIKPVVLRYQGLPMIYMRRDGYTNGATYEEIHEMSVRSSNIQYDVFTSDVPYEADNYTQLRAFYAMHNDGKRLTDKALQSMGFYNKDGMLANGALLFADDCHDPKTRVQCSVFSGYNKGSERIVTINRYEGNLTSVIQYVVEFVTQRMNHSMMKLDNGRINVDAYPQRALFEGVVNAVAHRDYYLDGTQIQVDMFRDRLEISSPGSFYRGERLDKTYDLSGVISKRRNELITSVLVSCNVMEAAGTGFDKIAEAYHKADEAHRPYIYSTSDHFTLVLPDLTYADGLVGSDVPHVTFVPVADGTDHDERVLAFCYDQARSAAEIAERLGMSNSSYMRKSILDNLVQQGYLETSKISRAVYYKTNRAMVTIE